MNVLLKIIGNSIIQRREYISGGIKKWNVLIVKKRCVKDIYNGKDDIVWTPKGLERSHFINHPHNYQLLLSKSKYIVSNKLKVQRCPKCKILIINEKNI